MPKTVEFQCAKCQQQVKAQAPENEIMNGIHASVVVFTHPPAFCACGQAYVYFVNNLKTVIGGFVPCALEQESSIIIPDGRLTQ